MNRTDYFNELDALKSDLDKWDYDTGLHRHTCYIGELTITVDRGRDGAHWKVEHDRFRLEPREYRGTEPVVAYAKRTAIDRARHWVEQNVEPAIHA